MLFMRKLTRWQRVAVIALAFMIVVPVLAYVILGLIPPAADPVLPPESIIVGAQGNMGAGNTGAISGVSLTFPEMPGAAGQTPTAAQQALGRLLFFDPILSADKQMSCATCHHPDLGFADGRARAQGKGGVTLARHAPSLYEVGYKTALMWDGRAATLESQITIPLTAADEMNNTPEAIVAALRDNAEYRGQFAAAFPGQPEPITFENVGVALAAFQRGLVAHNTPFDRYAAGDFTALTASQRRGFALFRSGATGCYRCHYAPTFSNGSFEVTGVPGLDSTLDDLGRGGVSNVAAEHYAFMTPTLRNVALTAPYMHNGRLATLEAVVDFYMQGGGTGMGLAVPTQSRFVRPFDLSEQERRDLINFLYALTDEGAAPGIPERVPSGLPVVGPQPNPGRELAAQFNQPQPSDQSRAAPTTRPPTTLTVTPGMTIQSVVDQAMPGDTIEIQYATYSERVVIDLKDITVRGVPNVAGDYPILDGKMQFSDGIAASGDNFTIEKLAVKNYRGNGIIVDGVTGVVIRDIYVENTSLYGVYPVHSTDVLVERVHATQIRDAGVYAGQCRGVVLRHNKVWANVIGIEIENSINAELYDNHAFDNATGIFVDLLPQLPSKVSQHTKVYHNLIEDNNHANFANEGEIGALVPSGGGILVLGGDDVEIYGNTIRNNRTAGIAIFSTATAFEAHLIDIGPNPERIHIHDNTYLNNGYQPDTALTELGLDGKDIIWDVSNWDVRVDEASATSFPPVLPTSGWSDHSRRAYWQVLHFIVTALG
jgi:parallel beta-helix repeat protein